MLNKFFYSFPKGVLEKGFWMERGEKLNIFDMGLRTEVNTSVQDVSQKDRMIFGKVADV